MQVGSICTRHIVTIDAQRPLTEAARRMRDQHVGTLVVTCSTSRGTEVCGIVTDRDLVIDALARDPLEMDIHVADLACTELAMIAESAELDDAIATMHESGVRRLLVSSNEDRLCGLLSIDDVIQAFAEQIGGLARVIRSGLERERGAIQATPAAPHLPRFPAMGTAAQALR
jgi:predicted transcriptional regulator